MLTNPEKSRFAPRAPALAILAAAVLGGSLFTSELHSQAPVQGASNAALIDALGKLKNQQAQLAANQTKIEAQTALLKEELRQSKIYSARGGGSRR